MIICLLQKYVTYTNNIVKYISFCFVFVSNSLSRSSKRGIMANLNSVPQPLLCVQI